MLAAWMALIFLFSSQGAKDSSRLSEGFARNLAQLFVRDFGRMPGAEQMDLIGGLQLLVRKGAHMFLFFVLWLLAVGAARTYKATFWRRLLAAFCLVLLYAVSDEVHQAFVPGRAAMASDVMIDMAGALAGSLAIVGARALKQKDITESQ